MKRLIEKLIIAIVTVAIIYIVYRYYDKGYVVEDDDIYTLQIELGPKPDIQIKEDSNPFVTATPFYFANEKYYFVGANDNEDDKLLYKINGQYLNLIDNVKISSKYHTYGAIAIHKNGYSNLLVCRANGVFYYRFDGKNDYEMKEIYKSDTLHPISISLSLGEKTWRSNLIEDRLSHIMRYTKRDFSKLQNKMDFAKLKNAEIDVANGGAIEIYESDGHKRQFRTMCGYPISPAIAKISGSFTFAGEFRENKEVRSKSPIELLTLPEIIYRGSCRKAIYLKFADKYIGDTVYVLTTTGKIKKRELIKPIMYGGVLSDYLEIVLDASAKRFSLVQKNGREMHRNIDNGTFIELK